MMKAEEGHPLILLTAAIDWEKSIQKAKEIRSKKLRMPQVGRAPHLRELIGALLFRTIKKCTLLEAMDMMKNYVPARILCGLVDTEGNNTDWTPDYRTLWDFEVLMGADGISELTADLLILARDFGFTDGEVLCSDTTAQEASIPYPTEVGLMHSFGKTIQSVLNTVQVGSREVRKQAGFILGDIFKKVRGYRLFAKTPEKKQEVTQSLLKLTKELHTFGKGIETELKAMGQKLKGQGLRGLKRLEPLLETVSKLIPQIEYFIRNGRPTSNKIISLFHPEIRAVVRGKVGKNVEFGLKWLINRVRGGYVWASIHSSLKQISDMDYAVKAIDEHIGLFGAPPKDFGFDRGAWSIPHIEKIQSKGVKRVAIAPTGKSSWKVSNFCRKRMIKERAQVEGSIGCLKRTGFNRPQTKNTQGMLRAAQRTVMRLNLTNLVRDIKLAMAA